MKPLINDDDVMTMDQLIRNVSPSVRSYKINRGDTLWKLARENGTTIEEILRLNPSIKDRNSIRAGDTIDIPGSRDKYREAQDMIDYALGDVPRNIPTAEQDAIQPVMPEAFIPAVRPVAAALGRGAMGALGQLARAAPAPLPRAGMPAIGPMQSNVAAPPNLNRTAVQAMLQGMRNQQLKNLPPPAAHRTGNQRLLDALKRQQSVEPTLDDLASLGARPNMQGVPFQELLRRIGYK